MKTRIKTTEEDEVAAYISEDKYDNVTTDTRTDRETELGMMSDKGDYFSTYDYWVSLEQTYAGLAMLGILAKYGVEPLPEDAAHDAYNYAHALVEMMKEVRK